MAHNPPERPQAAASGFGPPAQKKRLDAVVKFGLAVFVGSFMLIWGGMFLTRPDRSIPPYSIGSQDGTAVAVHVPGWTSDSAIETLINRFRQIGRDDRDFGRMKIQATTPNDSRGRYQRIQIYIFTLDAWTEPEMLRRYVSGGNSADDRDLREGFGKAVRGFYRLEELDGRLEEEGRIGPLVQEAGPPASGAYSRLLFRGQVSNEQSGATADGGTSGRQTGGSRQSPFRDR